MSGTVELRTYYGIETPRQTFWTQMGQAFVCSTHFNHAIPEGALYCCVCGSRTKTIAIEEPSPRFEEICEKAQISPDKFFELLTSDSPNQGWEWEDDGEGGTGKSFRLHWLAVEAFITVFSDEARAVSALGFKLDSLTDSAQRVAAVTWQQMEIYDRAMRDVAKIFGVTGEPKLYSQVFYA